MTLEQPVATHAPGAPAGLHAGSQALGHRDRSPRLAAAQAELIGPVGVSLDPALRVFPRRALR